MSSSSGRELLKPVSDRNRKSGLESSRWYSISGKLEHRPPHTGVGDCEPLVYFYFCEVGLDNFVWFIYVHIQVIMCLVEY